MVQMLHFVNEISEDTWVVADVWVRKWYVYRERLFEIREVYSDKHYRVVVPLGFCAPCTERKVWNRRDVVIAFLGDFGSQILRN